VQFEKVECETTEVGDSITSPGTSADQGKAKQPTISSSMMKASRNAYEKLLYTAYTVAINGLPMTNFAVMGKCQKHNGVSVLHGCEDVKMMKRLVNV